MGPSGPPPRRPPPPGRPGSGVALQRADLAVQTLYLVPSMLAEPAVRGAKENAEEVASTAVSEAPVPA